MSGAHDDSGLTNLLGVAMNELHVIHSRAGRIGGRADTGPDDVDKIVAALAADPRQHLVLHFHGGLVSKEAGMAKAQRRPCAENNAFRGMERAMAAAVEKGLEATAKARDGMAERVFHAVYDNPVARAAVGLRDVPPPQPLGADPARRELARREAQEVLARAAQGSVRDGIVRLVMMLLSDGVIDERGHRAMQAAWAGLPARFRGSQAEMREVVRREALLLRTDRAAALRGLRAIFADPEDRAVAEAAFRQAAAAVGARIDLTPDGPVARLLEPAGRTQPVGA
jgi:hypothetical protein